MLSILIVNYKSAALIKDCIQSLMTHSIGFPFEIIVIDNASNDNSEETLKAAFPFIRWIQMGYNSGFARANNEGIRQSAGDTVLLLNPDTLATDASVQQCYEALQTSPYVACGVQLLNADGTPQISGNYAMKGGLNYLLPLPYVGAVMKAAAGLMNVKKPNVPNTSTTTEVDWINGAFLMVKKEVLSRSGLMDEDFFLYAEEAEWCSRLKQCGKLCIFGQFTIIHLQGEVSNDAFNSTGKGYYNLFDKRGLQIILSNLVRIRKQFGVAWFLFILGVYTVTIVIFPTVGFAHQLLAPKKKLNIYSHWIGFTKNVGFVWQKLGIILKNEPYFYKVL